MTHPIYFKCWHQSPLDVTVTSKGDWCQHLKLPLTVLLSYL